MSPDRVAALLFFAGFVALVAGGLVAPPGVYAESALDGRLEIIAAHTGRWWATNTLGALGGLCTAAGFVVFGARRFTEHRVVIALGILAVGLSALALTGQSLRRASNPATELAGTALLDRVWLASFLASLVAFGIFFVQSSFPNWLGYLCIVGALALFGGSAVGGAWVAESAYIIPVVIAVVLWRAG